MSEDNNNKQVPEKEIVKAEINSFEQEEYGEKGTALHIHLVVPRFEDAESIIMQLRYQLRVINEETQRRAKGE